MSRKGSFFLLKSSYFCRVRLRAVTFGLTVLLAATSLLAYDWPQWRGPNRNGVSAEKGWLEQWPDTGPPVAWKGSVGMGFSTFSVAAGRVITTGNADEKDSIFCFDAVSGKELWRHSYPAELGDKFFEGGTSGTPCIDVDRVYALSRWGDVFCLNAITGKPIWSRNLQKDANMPVPSWGFGGSPVVHEGMLLLNVGESGMALDKASGKTIWQSAVKSAGYSTPLPVRPADSDKWSLILGSEKAYLAVDLLTGKEVWRMRWLTEYGVNAADPIVSGDKVFVATGYGKGAVLIQPWGAEGGEPKVIWKSKVLRSQTNPSVMFEGFLYGMDGDSDDKGPLKCIELATGIEKWAQPKMGMGALMIANGKLIVLSDHGELFVVPATPTGFKPTARAQVLGGKCWTAPVLANGKIYCRNSRGDVVCLDVQGSSKN